MSTGEREIDRARPAIVAYLALGSNLGDRQAHLKEAVRRLAADPRIEVLHVSSLYETDPVGGPPDQRTFLNAAVTVSTTLSPQALLEHGHQIEARLGRQRTVTNGPRTVDIDLLLYGDETCDGHLVKLPHPRMHLRRFVLVPLAEIAPQAVHPVLGRSVGELLDLPPAEKRDSADDITLFQPAPWVDV